MSEGLEKRGHDLRPSTAQVIPNLPAEGARMTELAARLRLTVQRAGQLVAELESLGYLQRVPDPEDGRARRVVFAPRGRRLVRDIEEITAEITRDFAAAIGVRRFDQLCRLLEALDVALNGEDAPIRVVARAREDAPTRDVARVREDAPSRDDARPREEDPGPS
jgi:DNA-binding MarR family transcriptional regulator